ncbi:hypothetical protein COI93_16660 [Bacillus cereus]|uniref:Peptidase C39-like domain-containing protein n=1 Tax=Bacillus cereus TaxID=1396 RepID=A0A2B0LP79_BACCE|nr:hypothetical protein COI93_16660 [Bacillus cereus]
MKKKLPVIILSSALLLSPIHSYANTEINKNSLHTGEQTNTVTTNESLNDTSQKNNLSTDKKEQIPEKNGTTDKKEQIQEKNGTTDKKEQVTEKNGTADKKEQVTEKNGTTDKKEQVTEKNGTTDKKEQTRENNVAPAIHAPAVNVKKEESTKKEGWIKENNTWYYYSNNTKVTGWKNDKGYWYYLHKNGDMATGWTKVNSKWYFLSQNGIMHTGWYSDGANWYYLHQDGSMATGWTKVNGKWYFLSQNGTMHTGWYSDGANWYYLHPGGSMATGWTKVEGKWYLLQSDGAMRTGWYFDGANWYYLHGSGHMATGWTKVEGKWYYLYEDGVMKKESVYLDAPMIFQLPELHNGCEVVSMTMMLKYHGHNVDKLTLAKQLPVDSTPMVKGAGSILIWGDPSVGFVGDVKGISPGYSIDPTPLKKVLDRYTSSGINLTGSDFSKVERLVAQGKPVVTWITASFSHPVAPKTWKTPSGKTIQADFDMHAVLVTGYDNDYVYINDPLRRGKGAKIPKQKFISSYNYMGKKALSML